MASISNVLLHGKWLPRMWAVLRARFPPVSLHSMLSERTEFSSPSRWMMISAHGFRSSEYCHFETEAAGSYAERTLRWNRICDINAIVGERSVGSIRAKKWIGTGSLQQSYVRDTLAGREKRILSCCSCCYQSAFGFCCISIVISLLVWNSLPKLLSKHVSNHSRSFF